MTCELKSSPGHGDSEPPGGLLSNAAESEASLTWKGGRPLHTGTLLRFSPSSLRASGQRITPSPSVWTNPTSVGRSELGKVCRLLGSASLWEASVPPPLIFPPEGSENVAVKYCCVLNSVWFLRSSSVHITQPFKEFYIFSVVVSLV